MSQIQPPQDQTIQNPSGNASALIGGFPNYSNQMNPPSDEIDLVELLAFFWKIKLEIALGATVGLLLGGLVAWRVLPVTYRTQIPLVLEKSETVLGESKKMVENFNNALNVSDNARVLWRSVFNQSPELARLLKEENLNEDSLAAAQALSDKPEKSPLRLRESASPRDFILDVQLPVQGLSVRSGELFASALQLAFHSAGSAADQDKDVASKPANANSPGGTPVQSVPTEESYEYREQLLKARQELLKIEYLCARLGRGVADFSSFVSANDSGVKSLQINVPASAEMSGQTAMSSDYQEQLAVQGQFERTQRMTAVLLAEGRMKPEDANDILTRAVQIRDDIFQLIPAARREANRIAAISATKKSSSLMSNTSARLPVLVPASATGAPIALEEPLSKRKIALVLGIFLGAFAGFAIGGLRIFIQKNGQRLREVVAA
ncbi:MAG: hypothetical protein RIR26_513 [Pseudomonadota bacterium]|jgi:hypothetical protein